MKNQNMLIWTQTFCLVGMIWLCSHPGEANTREDNIATGLGKVCTRVAAIEKRLLNIDVSRGNEQTRIIELERNVEMLEKKMSHVVQILKLQAESKKADK